VGPGASRESWRSDAQPIRSVVGDPIVEQWFGCSGM